MVKVFSIIVYTFQRESIVKFIEDISVNNVNFSYTGEQPNGTFVSKI